MKLDYDNYTSTAAVIISVISLFQSSYQRKIKIDATLELDENGFYVTIYNNSERDILVSNFEIFRSNLKYLSSKKPFKTWYNDGYSTSYLIKKHSKVEIRFQDEYEIDGFIKKALSQNVYITLYVARKKVKTVKIA